VSAGARFFAGQIPFMVPRQQCQSAEGNYSSSCLPFISNKLCGMPPLYASALQVDHLTLKVVS